MEDDLNFLKMENDINLFGMERRWKMTYIYNGKHTKIIKIKNNILKWKTIQITFEKGRGPKFLKWRAHLKRIDATKNNKK